MRSHPAGRIVPVQVLELAEFDLGLELVPVEGLREELEIDALLMGDLKAIKDGHMIIKGGLSSSGRMC